MGEGRNTGQYDNLFGREVFSQFPLLNISEKKALEIKPVSKGVIAY